MIYPVNYISISQGFHHGKCLDFGWWKEKYRGQDIVSIDEGIVYKVEQQEKGGNVVYIKHPSGIISCYAHLNKVYVKKNQKVLLAQAIGTMGETGQVSGMHLHFGLYSKGKNIYGNADLNPFDYLRVYPNQVVRTTGLTKEYLNDIKYYQQPITWKEGNYQLIVSKCIRTSPNLGNNIVKVKDCKSATKKVLTSTKPNDKAKIRVNTVVTITKIIDENGRIWGKYGNCYIVLCNIDGTPQAIKV